jgi:hypothetical protein
MLEQQADARGWEIQESSTLGCSAVALRRESRGWQHFENFSISFFTAPPASLILRTIRWKLGRHLPLLRRWLRLQGLHLVDQQAGRHGAGREQIRRFFTYLNDAVMGFISFAAVMVLLTSLIGLAIWMPRLMWRGLSRLLS